MAYGYLYWRFTKYGIVGNVLQVQTGVLFRQNRQVKLDRLQAVDIVRPLVARLVGLAELRLEVAGGGSSEAPLAFLSLPGARQLRAELLARAAGLDAETPEAPERPLVQVPTGQLALGSLLSGTTVALVVVGIGLAAAAAITGTAAFLVPFAPALIGLVLAATRQFVNNYGFTVAEAPDGLRITKGLLDTRAQTVPPGRVQAVRVSQPLLWRPLDLVRIDVNVAGYAADSQAETEKTSVLLPVGSRAVAYEVLLRSGPARRPGQLSSISCPRRAAPRRLRPIGWRYLAAGRDRRRCSPRAGAGSDVSWCSCRTPSRRACGSPRGRCSAGSDWRTSAWTPRKDPWSCSRCTEMPARRGRSWIVRWPWNEPLGPRRPPTGGS